VLYDAALVPRYVKAMHAEIDRYFSLLGAVEVDSIYIGGGTPTTILDELGPILEHIRRRFGHKGIIAVETTPDDLDPENLCKLRALGVNLLSIGVQSFDDRYLKLIGRKYRASILGPVISSALSAGFDTVNLDLMFALPGQTTGEALADLDTALDLGAEQVTVYPLFTFPYAAVGKHLKLKQVAFPKLGARRQMYKAIHSNGIAHGFDRVSVWGFKKNHVARFSSVTRNHYIGLGAGAGTHLPGLFYFNTFSVAEYIRSCSENDLPVALQMSMSSAMERFFWLYWRLYETCIPKDGFARLFATDLRLKSLLSLALGLHLLTDNGDSYVLTERGSFWIHLLQNYYILNYIDKVWATSMRDAWPARVEL
jgi:oxygen-independent coproporphyrinogen-3 oxidase